jgi:PilZ domain-containing protein
MGTPMGSPSERRRHARYPFERHLEVRAPEPHGKLLVHAHDISESGFSFATSVQLSVGDRLLLGLRHDDDVLVEAEVRNVRVSEDGFIVGAERIGAPDLPDA